MPTTNDLTPQEIAAALAARRELGVDYEDAIAASLAERMGRELDARVAAGLTATAPPVQPRAEPRPRHFSGDQVVPIISMIAAIPITAITVNANQTPALAIAWLGLVFVNVANAWGRRRH